MLLMNKFNSIQCIQISIYKIKPSVTIARDKYIHPLKGGVCGIKITHFITILMSKSICSYQHQNIKFVNLFIIYIYDTFYIICKKKNIKKTHWSN